MSALGKACLQTMRGELSANGNGVLREMESEEGHSNVQSFACILKARIETAYEATMMDKWAKSLEDQYLPGKHNVYAAVISVKLIVTVVTTYYPERYGCRSTSFFKGTLLTSP